MPNVLLDFNNLNAGDVVENQYSANGVTISSASTSNPVMVFDTANPTGGDTDLATNNLSNVLIISEDGDSSDPDDNGGGGTFVFEFDAPTTVINFNVLDIEQQGSVRLYDVNGNLMADLPLTVTGDNGQGVMNVNYDNVARMEVELDGYGAIDNVCFEEPVVQPTGLDGVVEGSNDADVIDASYDQDPDGDCIDVNDQILLGEGQDDDIVDGFGGNDIIKSGAGDDEVYAGTGDDLVEGGTGDDVIFGDSNYTGEYAGVTVRESFEWSKSADATGNNASLHGFTQDTGSVNVSFEIHNQEGTEATEFENTDQLVSGIVSDGNAINDNSSMYSLNDVHGDKIDYNGISPKKSKMSNFA